MFFKVNLNICKQNSMRLFTKRAKVPENMSNGKFMGLAEVFLCFHDALPSPWSQNLLFFFSVAFNSKFIYFST